MEIVIDLGAKQARAATFQDSMMFHRAEGNPALQGELNRFLNQWLTNIENQGFRPERASHGR